MLQLLLLILWVAWCVQAVLSAMQVRKFAKRFDLHRNRQAYRQYRPPAAVIVPVKGVAPDLEANLRSLAAQDYGDYRLVFVVESEDDPAHALLQRLIGEIDRPADLLVAGRAGPDQGQKVHNQLAALAHLRAAGYGEEVWVFADDDAVPGPTWLGDLVGPLAHVEKTGATTGYRWLVPAPDPATGRATLWSHLASIMNSSVACFLGREAFNQAWGGSMAMRVDTADRGDLVGLLRGALTDDYQVTRLCRNLGLRVYFVSRCLVASPVRFRLAELVNFAHRQYLITRVYAPGLYAAAVGMLGLYVAGWASAWAGLIIGLVRGSGIVVPAAAAIVIVAVAEQVRAGHRRQAVAKAFGGTMVRRLRFTLLLDRWATPVWMTLHLLLVLRAGVGRTMRWRGTRYRLLAPQRVQRL